MNIETPNFVSKVYEIPGSSFKLQIVKTKENIIVRIFRGPILTKEIPLSLVDFSKNFIVTLIQTELFMPISPFKISKEVEKAICDIENGRTESEKILVPDEMKSAENIIEKPYEKFIKTIIGDTISGPVTPSKVTTKYYVQPKVETKLQPTILSMLAEEEVENKKADTSKFIIDYEHGVITPSKCALKEYIIKSSQKKK